MMLTFPPHPRLPLLHFRCLPSHLCRHCLHCHPLFRPLYHPLHCLPAKSDKTTQCVFLFFTFSSLCCPPFPLCLTSEALWDKHTFARVQQWFHVSVHACVRACVRVCVCVCVCARARMRGWVGVGVYLKPVHDSKSLHQSDFLVSTAWGP